ncbi:hypothetical protein KY331_06385 [Candidatus Woesearchaeota archaeon]|nr:hypothetical protein [Candidatus Woesearchaeota archaeon]
MKLFKEALKELENSKKFKDWQGNSSGVFLSYGFLMVSGDKEDSWKIGYYHKKDDMITSFNVGEKIEIEPESEVFKRETTKINEIDLKKIKFDIDKAVEIAKRLQEEKYANEKPNKIIVILQKIKIGQIWNITYITQTMKTLNFKINTETGKILEHKLTSLFEYRQ